MDTPSATLDRLRREKADNPQPPERTPERLHLKEISTEPLVFQVRAEGLDMDRVGEIAGDLSALCLDEPIHLWWSGLRWIVIDGHHRLEAIKLAQERGGETRKVAVKAHPAMPLEEAFGAASPLNAREKVTITREERGNAAWRLVCCGTGSIKDQAAWTGASKSQISIMRAVFDRLRAKPIHQETLIDQGWDWARMLDQGKDEREFHSDMIEAQAQEWAKKLGSAIGGQRMVESPEALARALEIISPALPSSLIQTVYFWDALDGGGRALLEEVDKEQSEELDGNEIIDF
ncbi:hypothetical protein SAMN04487859_102218 [Roseovarius lutimaris]|uniref:ParB-like nuclease domain-containing protein n=1 Tax=Roseovarius lutimaris TaxID=1005928 RepID=A0A1I4Z1G4_9RHOB|nr:hypothetical protein [Roseovarius lutimaris]SFN44017.1 hypothetical protein SAMN04487859_102218 [Roseovarius lutimaris]